MIRLFRRNENDFNHNEWILNQTSKCLVTEVSNGNFELDLEYPVQDKKQLSQYLTTGNIIKCDVGDSRGEQLFRIRKVSGDKTKVVFAQSKLIADLSANRIQAFTITGKTRKEAIQLVLNAALETHDYVVGNKDTNTNNGFIVNIQEGSVLDALVGSENSILSVYGGEFIIDNNTIDIVDNRGIDRGFDIRYGKNIKGITPTEDDTDLATVIIPKVGDLRLPEYVVESSNVNAYEKRYFKELDIQGLKVWDGEGTKESDEITESEAFIKMREASNLLFTKDHVDLINFTYELDLAILSKTEEYKSKKYYLMEDVFLSDTVKVYHEILNIDLFGKVSKTVYNVLLGKYDSVTVGFQKQNITDIINQTIRNIKFTKEEILLKVSNMSNDLYTQIQLTEDTLRLEATDIKNDLQGQITVQAEEIDLKVSKGSEFSSEMRQNISAFQFLFEGASSGKTEIDATGITVYQGGFRIKDNNGNTILSMNADGVIVVNDIEIIDTSIGSWFYNALLGMDELRVMSTIRGGNGEFSDLDVTDLYVSNDLNVNGSFYADYGEILNDFYVDDTLYTESLEVVGGSKNCTQETENFGLRKINAYETAEYFFGDIGSGVIQNGECLIAIDAVFQECINTDVEYHVFIQVYNGSVTSVERYPNYFIVYGTENTNFSWELKAKRKGFENNRLELSNYSK